MKTILFLLALMFTTATHAQLTEKETAGWNPIGKLKFGGITKASLEYQNNGRDTTLLLFVKDFREQPKNNYFSIQFKNTDGTFSKLYAILKSFFLEENKKNKSYSRTFQLGNTTVNVSHKILITGRGIMFYTKDGYANWSERDVDKLFGMN
jgi:hypothetical protein